MPRTIVGDIAIYYERNAPRTDAPKLLFISGTGGDLRYKPNTMDGPFPKNFDTVAYDQRGLGQTSKPDKPYTMAQYADDAAGLMDAVGWAKAHVVGISFGGMVAQELVLRHPARVDRLVLGCTSPGGAGGASYPLHELQQLSAAERARVMIPVIDRRRDEAWAKANPGEYQQLLTPPPDPYADEPGRAMGARRQIEARSHHDTWERLGRIQGPTLIAAGKYDGMARPETQENMHKRIKGSKLEWFEGGHLFTMQDPKATPAMIAFLGAG